MNSQVHSIHPSSQHFHSSTMMTQSRVVRQYLGCNRSYPRIIDLLLMLSCAPLIFNKDCFIVSALASQSSQELRLGRLENITSGRASIPTSLHSNQDGSKRIFRRDEGVRVKAIHPALNDYRGGSGSKFSNSITLRSENSAEIEVKSSSAYGHLQFKLSIPSTYHIRI